MNDSTLAAFVKERSDHVAFVDDLLNQQRDGDLSDRELEMVRAKQSRIEELDVQIDTLSSFAKARQSAVEVGVDMVAAPAASGPVEYRSAGEYLADRWQAGAGVPDAQRRMTQFHRVAAHQTTADNPVTVPDPILGPVLNYIDTARPIVASLGVRGIPNGPSFYRPHVTQNTSVAAQAAEKNELASQKMLIERLQVDIATFGGYVNVSRQDIDWSTPSALDLVVNDLAGQYAIATEGNAAGALEASATVSGATIAGASDAEAIAQAFWTAAAGVYGGTQGLGSLIAVCNPAVLPQLATGFAPYSPQNAQQSNMMAANYGQGPQGFVSGIPVYASNGLQPTTLLVLSTAAAEAYETRIGTLSVVEPSVLGTQVAYAGYFGVKVLKATGVQSIATTV